MCCYVRSSTSHFVYKFSFAFTFNNVICVLFRVTEEIPEILDHLDIREKRYFVTALQAGRLVQICPTLSEHIC